MRFRFIPPLFCGILILGAAGCGTATSTVPAVGAGRAATDTMALSRGSSTDAAGFGPAAAVFAYSCDGTCNVYNARGKVIKTVSTGLNHAMGTATDSTGNWYVANSGASTIVEYSAGGGSVLNTLSDGGRAPVDVAISESTNTIAVANASPRAGKGAVSVYTIGATKPRAVLSDPNAVKGLSVAFDDRGNCYYAYSSGSVGAIDEFVRCSGSPHSTGVVDFINGIAFDGANNLYYSFQSTGTGNGGVNKCSGVAHCQLLSAAFGDPTAVRFNHRFSKLLVADIATSEIWTLTPQGVAKPFASASAQGVAFATGPRY
jgi:hypothetical protein